MLLFTHTYPFVLCGVASSVPSTLVCSYALLFHTKPCRKFKEEIIASLNVTTFVNIFQNSPLFYSNDCSMSTFYQRICGNDRNHAVRKAITSFFRMKHFSWIISFLRLSIQNFWRKESANVSAISVTHCYRHCVKSVPIQSFFWFVFSRILTEYVVYLSIFSPNAENMDL